MQLLIRFFGIIGLVLAVIPFQFKKHRNIVLCKMVSEVSFAVQYFLLGAYTGAWLDLISGARNFLFYKLVQKNRSTVFVILAFSAFVIILGLYSWAGAISLLPMIAKLLTTVSYGMKNEKYLRLITLPSCVFWILYNCFVGGWEGMISDSLSLLSILIAIYKFDIKPARQDILDKPKTLG